MTHLRTLCSLCHLGPPTSQNGRCGPLEVQFYDVGPLAVEPFPQKLQDVFYAEVVCDLDERGCSSSNQNVGPPVSIPLFSDSYNCLSIPVSS